MENEQQERAVSENKSEKNNSAESGEIQANLSQSEPEEKETEKDFIEKIFEYTKGQSDKSNIYVQYRIYNNHGVMAGDDAQFESIHFNDTDTSRKRPWKGSVFKDRNGLSKWIADNYASYSMALMIAVAAFDSLPYTWIIQAAERLYESFDNLEEKSNVYAHEEILHQFEAEICKGEMNTYTGTTLIDIVHLINPKYRETMLKYIWQQYPQLQDKIISWLQSYTTHRPISMSKRALETMGFLACEDYYYFLYNIVPKIAENKSISTDMQVGQILIFLNQRDNYKNNVYHLLHAWSRESRLHNLLTALFVCAQLNDKNDILEDIIENYIQKTLLEIRQSVSLTYQSGLYDFMGSGIRAFTFYRLLIEKLENAVNEQPSMRERRDVYGLFLKLFAIDISQSRIKNGEDAVLIMLCMTKHAISDRLCSLWRMIWQCNHFRRLVYDLMIRYDAKVKGTNSKYSVERFVDKVLSDIYPRERRLDICSKIHRRSGNV